MEELETKVSSFRYEGKYPGRAAGAPDLTPQEDAELKRLRKANKRMRRLNQAIRAAYSSDDSPEQKREQIDDYMLQMLEIAREVIGKPKADFRPNSSAPSREAEFQSFYKAKREAEGLPKNAKIEMQARQEFEGKGKTMQRNRGLRKEHHASIREKGLPNREWATGVPLRSLLGRRGQERFVA